MMRELSGKVRRVIESEKISPTELDEMIKRAAITSKGDCNRRFHHWIFLTVAGDSAVLDMKHAEQLGRGNVATTCPRCGGQGGPCCGWWGTVLKTRN